MSPFVFVLLTAQDSPVTDRVKTEPRTNIPIICQVTPTMFPASWRKEPVQAQAVPLRDSEVARSQNLMITAMAKYPAEFLKKELKAVYVSQEIKFYGLKYGGTNSNDIIYLANEGAPRGYTDFFLESAFHHEFSSILLRNHRSNLDETTWNKALPQGFTYRGDGTQSVREGTASTRYNQEFHKDGFLAQYATSSIEEDFNMISEGLFMGSKRYWAAVDQNPKLKAKVGLVIAFYDGLDPSFTEDFFRSQVRDRIR